MIWKWYLWILFQFRFPILFQPILPVPLVAVLTMLGMIPKMLSALDTQPDRVEAELFPPLTRQPGDVDDAVYGSFYAGH